MSNKKLCKIHSKLCKACSLSDTSFKKETRTSPRLVQVSVFSAAFRSAADKSFRFGGSMPLCRDGGPRENCIEHTLSLFLNLGGSWMKKEHQKRHSLVSGHLGAKDKLPRSRSPFFGLSTKAESPKWCQDVPSMEIIVTEKSCQVHTPRTQCIQSLGATVLGNEHQTESKNERCGGCFKRLL